VTGRLTSAGHRDNLEPTGTPLLVTGRHHCQVEQPNVRIECRLGGLYGSNLQSELI